MAREKHIAHFARALSRRQQWGVEERKTLLGSKERHECHDGRGDALFGVETDDERRNLLRPLRAPAIAAAMRWWVTKNGGLLS
ncbi:hypothetical protein [uncultured Rhodoblastus sp.]|uniref:hypothetical protein n=1 Tax=uncultured Rhodoblastus sp. TaxID=543037 RepID=UPI0025CDEDB8|nr:hypothetical protein [uncultured Rhodoblastus sp.]